MKRIQIGLKSRIFLLCVFLCSISVVVGGMAFSSFANVADDFGSVVDKSVPKLELTVQMMVSFQQVRIALRTLGLSGVSQELGDRTVKQAEDAIAQYERQYQEYLKLGLNESEMELQYKLKERWLAFKAVGAEVIKLYHTGSKEVQPRMIEIFLKDCPEAAEAFASAISEMIKFSENSFASQKSNVQADVKSSRLSILIVIALGIVIGLSTGFYLANTTYKTISSATDDLKASSGQVAQAANQIAASSNSLSQSASVQASSLQQTVSTMRQLSQQVVRNTNNAKQAAVLAASTQEVALKGESSIKTLIGSINSIAADSKKIEEITSVIDDIAFQTNLLALNAAVEAARAGEQGRGFAVVADAVRSLAQRSSVAAKDIATLIQNSVQKIEIGSQQASDGEDVLNEIVASVKKVAGLNDEIARASEEQSAGITQIDAAMSQLDEVTKENASASQESAAAAEELAAQSVNLKSHVQSLEIVLKGKSEEEVASVLLPIPGKRFDSLKRVA